ncbi:uncharacterized protein J8A68_002068 [[Candida] subhashii]|uniref:Glycoside-hydrolase family GH114 TIM-barrel domain-containing protein n=1 Tax=[Candida] subhashii TaxID=561895 RepID=A0A8J5QPW4_9ASCO|nr:uncharacterized protein J8A68_002068 [[Candida] subhashii]KAG7664395.1 hypothetical protein J8A68_002068 [[Candida] subhashii]
MMISVKILLCLLSICCSVGLGLSLGLGIEPEKRESKSKWKPKIGSSWDYQLSNPLKQKQISKSIDNYGIDLFDNSKKSITNLQKQENKKIICYFSAGSYENWRPDKSEFVKSDLGKNMDGWPGEKWLNIRSKNVRKIMEARIKLASEKGCDAIDPDNINGYENDTGFKLTKQDAVDYVKFLSGVANKYGLSMGLKNGGEIAKSVINEVEFCIQEQCGQYSECEMYQIFIKNSKPVFHVEYPKGDKNTNKNVSEKTYKKYCGFKDTKGFSTILKNLDLDEWIQICK